MSGYPDYPMGKKAPIYLLGSQNPPKPQPVLVENRPLPRPTWEIRMIFCNVLSIWKASVNEKDVQLRAEIKQLLREAATLSEPSTFAQSAKLKRMAAAKERELARSQESASKKIKPIVVLFERMLMISKVLAYLMLIVWFWRTPVATIPKEIVQPFGRFLSLRTGLSFSNTVMVGIIPWLILSNRVGKYFCDIMLISLNLNRGRDQRP